MATALAGRLGQSVIYRDSSGHRKLAFVVGDPESIVHHGDFPEAEQIVPALAGTARHLLVISPAGGIYLRHSVRSAAEAAPGERCWSDQQD